MFVLLIQRLEEVIYKSISVKQKFFLDETPLYNISDIKILLSMPLDVATAQFSQKMVVVQL